MFQCRIVVGVAAQAAIQEWLAFSGGLTEVPAGQEHIAKAGIVVGAAPTADTGCTIVTVMIHSYTHLPVSGQQFCMLGEKPT